MSSSDLHPQPEVTDWDAALRELDRYSCDEFSQITRNDPEAREVIRLLVASVRRLEAEQRRR